MLCLTMSHKISHKMIYFLKNDFVFTYYFILCTYYRLQNEWNERPTRNDKQCTRMEHNAITWYYDTSSDKNPTTARYYGPK